MQRFKGVATKYLDSSLGWFRLLDRSDPRGGLQPALVLEAAMGNQSVTSIRQKSLFCLLAPVNKAQDAMKSGVLSAKKAAFVRRRLAGLLLQG